MVLWWDLCGPMVAKVQLRRALCQSVLVKFHNTHVGQVSRVMVSNEDGVAVDTVPIEPITAKFYGCEGVTLQ